VNGQIIEVKGRDVRVAYHPSSGEPRAGDALLLEPRGSAGPAVVVQVIGYDSAGYPGDKEVALGELLESAIAERHDVVQGEPALVDLKEIKVARCKIRKLVRSGKWVDWDGHIPSRNVRINPISGDELLRQVLPHDPRNPVELASYRGAPVPLEARAFDKVNVLVGNKGTGKSHTAKLIVEALRVLTAPCWVYDINREFINLPSADVIRVGDNFKLSLAEVGFSFLMAVIEDLGPLQETSRGAFENVGPRLMNDEIKKTGFATVEYLEEQAGMGHFHSNDMVNQAIETRLRMVRRSGLFATTPDSESLVDRFWRIAQEGKFLVFDLAELPPRRLRALTRGLNRRLESICNEERKNGRGRFPFVFLEEAHFYTSPEEILNLITRGRHLGLTTFFITNTPAQLPEVVFRQIDNMICTGLGHSGDLRTVAKSALSDEETLQSLAVGLRMTEALTVGRMTAGFPLVVDINPLPDGFPETGVTRSYWDQAGSDDEEPPALAGAA
jgi:uncharacterized protein